MAKLAYRRVWTDDENVLLKMAVEKYDEKHWKLIAREVGTKNEHSCYQHWFRVINPTISKGRFSDKELHTLCWYVKKYGENKWSKISNHMPGRTDTQCRGRWVDLLASNQKKYKILIYAVRHLSDEEALKVLTAAEISPLEEDIFSQDHDEHVGDKYGEEEKAAESDCSVGKVNVSIEENHYNEENMCTTPALLTPRTEKSKQTNREKRSSPLREWTVPVPRSPPLLIQKKRKVRRIEFSDVCNFQGDFDVPPSQMLESPECPFIENESPYFDSLVDFYNGSPLSFLVDMNTTDDLWE